MEEINKTVHKELTEYAQLYFAAIVKANTWEGKCNFPDGKYSAAEVHKWDIYNKPSGEIFDEKITVSAGTFNCSFNYRDIFRILSKWESMSKAGRNKAVFEVGEPEKKSSKVLINEKTNLGAYKLKSMKLQRVEGNWYRPRKLTKSGPTALVYDLNGAMFIPGLQASGSDLEDKPRRIVDRCAQLDDTKITQILLRYLATMEEDPAFGYFAEAARLAGIETESEGARAIMDAARETARKQKEENLQEASEEEKRRQEAEEERRRQAAEEEREAKDALAKAKINFLSGKMISLPDFESIAESLSYGINIRTIGALRKRISWIETKDGDSVTVYGAKTRRGLEGTFEAIREVYALAKAEDQAESEAETKQAAQAIETPQIPPESAETVNVSAEGEKAGETQGIGRERPRRTLRLNASGRRRRKIVSERRNTVNATLRRRRALSFRRTANSPPEVAPQAGILPQSSNNSQIFINLAKVSKSCSLKKIFSLSLSSFSP